MRKTLLSFLAIALFIPATYAQQCSTGPANIHAKSLGTAGLQPYPEDLPCTVTGQPVYDTIYFQNFTNINYGGSNFTVQALKIDTVSNLPPGLCWVTNRLGNTYSTGDTGVIYVTGTPTGGAGQYKLHIIADVTINGGLTLPIDAETAGLRYWIRQKCPGTVCTPLDTNPDNNGNYPTYTAYATCVGPPVAAISPAGAVTLCAGSSLLLTASSGTGYTYKWSTGATTDTIRVSTAGSYTVTVYNSVDSAVSTATVVTVVSLPNAAVTPAGPVSHCPGDSTVLTAVTPGLTYAWSSGANTQSTTITLPTSYTLTVTDANSCSAVSAPVFVQFYSAPPAVTVRNGSTLTAGTGTGFTYQWYQDSVLLAGDTSASITITANGSYAVNITNANGCQARSAATVVTNVGISDINANAAIRLYPNPSEGQLTLETSGRTGDTYQVYDALGKNVLIKTITADKVLIDMSGQAAGVYSLTIKHNSDSETIRFTVIK